MTFQAFLLFLLVVVLVYMIIDTFMPDNEKMMMERLEGMKLYSASEKERQLQKSLLSRLYTMAETLVLRYFGNQVANAGSLAPLQIKITQAGLEETLEPIQHRAKRFIFAIGFAVLTMPTNNYKFTAIAVAVGLLYPDYKLKNLINARKDKIRNEIPDFLDLLAATFPGSKGFEDAVQKICVRSSGIIPDEFQKLLDEINAGKRKRDALKAMAERCGINEIDMLVNQIIQSEMLGTGLEDTLKKQADKMRILKKTQAEIKAKQAAITLLLPAIFLLTTIIIVIAGPSILQLLQAFGSM